MKQEQKPRIVKTQVGWKCVGEKLEAYGGTPEMAYSMYSYLLETTYFNNIPKDSMKWLMQGYDLFAPEQVDRRLFERVGAIKKFDATDYSHMPYKYSGGCAPLTEKEKEHLKRHAGGNFPF